MVRHAGTRALLVGLAALASSVLARAQPAEPAPAPKPDQPTVLFLMPAFDAEVQAQLREALLAQFAQLGATLAFEPATPGAETLSERVTRVQALAAQRGAIAVFWIEDQPDGRWFVYMMDSELQRILVRTLDAQPERRAAAIEAIAVMASESTRALIETPSPTTTTPAAPPPVAPPPPAPGPTTTPAAGTEPSDAMPGPLSNPLRVAVGYVGTAFASEVNWQHGLALGASWMGWAPFFAGASYVFTPSFKRDDPSDHISFDVTRYPVTAHGGMRYTQDRIALDAQLGFTLEWLSRTSKGTAVAMAAIGPAKADTKLLLILSPRVRVELRAFPVLAFFASGGVDILLNQFSYVLTKGKPSLLNPYQARPVAEAGIAFYP